MFFLNPMFLWAGFAVLIPPIIHLFNFRKYKTVYFSDIRFLENIRQTTQRKSVLKQILLMVLRMLAIAALVLAFAQPVINTAPSSSLQNRQAPPVIYLDNSFSMQTGENQASAIETAKNRALEIADAYPSETKFLFITNDFSQEHFRLVNALSIRDFLQDVTVSPSVRTLSEVIGKAEQNLNLLDIPSGSQKNIYLISDFQKNICDFDAVVADSLTEISLVPISQTETANIAIDTCIFNTQLRRVGQHEDITVVLKNYGTKPCNNIPLTLVVNGKQKSAQSFSIAPGERKELSVKYVNETKEFVRGVLGINDFPVDFDNTLYFSYQLDTIAKVLLIGNGESNKYFSALLGKDADFELDICTDINRQDISFNSYKTVILNQMTSIPHHLAASVHSFVSGGGNLIFVPSFSGNISDYNYLLNMLQCNSIISKDTVSCNVSKIDVTSPLLRTAVKDLKEKTDLPLITKYFNSMSNAYTGEDIIVETDSYKKMLTHTSYNNGHVYVFYCPLDANSGNFVTHRLFVPLIYNAASTCGDASTPYSVIGSNSGIRKKIDNFTDGSKIYIKQKDDGYGIIPRISGPDAGNNYIVFAENGVTKAGFYNLEVNEVDIAALSFNYSRSESQLQYYTADETAEKLEAKLLKKVNILDAAGIYFAEKVVQTASSKPLWRWFVMFALLFLVTEIFFERIF